MAAIRRKPTRTSLRRAFSINTRRIASALAYPALLALGGLGLDDGQVDEVLPTWVTISTSSVGSHAWAGPIATAAATIAAAIPNVRVAR